MMPIKDKAVHRFSIIRYKGDPTKAQLNDKKKTWVYRKDRIIDPRTGYLIPVAPYDNHFIFELPLEIVGPHWQCTCGSAAGYVGSNVYGKDASPIGALLVCLHHATHGVHADGEQKWV